MYFLQGLETSIPQCSCANYLMSVSSGRLPLEGAWLRADGRFVDPLRPQIEPDGFPDPKDVATSRFAHLEAVRKMFMECDIFIFTLGLTETWVAKSDGAAFPVAPGVSGGVFNNGLYEYVNLKVDLVITDLTYVLTELKLVNPGVRAILTVSPVPLIATYENRSVVLLDCVQQICSQGRSGRDHSEFFVGGTISLLMRSLQTNNNSGRYFAPDFREVNHLGVAHAMRCFFANFVEADPAKNTDVSAYPSNAGRAVLAKIICDEEALDAVRG